ncbi:MULTISPECIES: hypothetical protein [unclassified Mesorhizobium]|uniref:hypothetical protein n=1 Tax=unclassified Mesorhizobium TaxID=325217 RepID=UPI001926D157|nr:MULTISPECIES: hypothetical protein [unclassified Mesorhizobium]
MLAIYGSSNVMDCSPEDLAASRLRRDVARFELTYRPVNDNRVLFPATKAT